MLTRKQLRRTWRRLRRRLGAVLLRWFGPTALRLIAGSWKLEEIGRENMEVRGESGANLVTLWHGRMVMGLFQHRGRGHRVLVSPSDDGSLTTGMLAHFGYGVIRGSSNRSPARSLREMLSTLEQGMSVVITPDGPRGPRHSTNPGAAWLAREARLPIIPVGIVAAPARHLKSWDAFTIPKWGARVLMLYGAPIWIPPDADDEALDGLTDQVRSAMMELEEEGFRRLGVARDW